MQKQDVLFLHHNHEGNSLIEVVYKWGPDGRGGHSNDLQITHCMVTLTLFCYNNIPITINPSQLSENRTTNGKHIIWQNPSSASSRYSRIIRQQIEKETKESVKLHYNEIEDQISRSRK